MSELVGICGESGTGKSTACRTLEPKVTAIVNCVGKPLPIKGWKKNYTPFKGTEGNYFASDESKKIMQFMDKISSDRPEIKNIIIDDWQYTMSNEFMRRSSEKGFDKFTEIGKHAWEILNKAKSLREDLTVYILTHSDTQKGEFGAKDTIKIKTIGKLLDDKINPAGLFTILMFTDVHKKENGEIEYRFVTNNDGNYPAKSPMGMFDNVYIPNDLGAVSKAIEEFYHG
jgi:ABC-type dipeptide/oligopeptide/nickel transport system ATPase component